MTALARWQSGSEAANSWVCVGLDTDLSRLPGSFRDHPQPQYAFNRWIIDETHLFAAAYKLNVAFYEARGEAGWAELRLTTEYLRQRAPAAFTICDAKRGDIGSTNAAYATAFFDTLGFDAITLHPYLGYEALEPFLSRADKACILLCRTSNPGARELQDLVVEGRPLWLWIAERVAQYWNAQGNCMLVVGATYPDEMRRIRAAAGDIPFLVPGIGAQGGDLRATIRSGMNQQGGGLIINASRSIIFASDPGAAARDLRDQINQLRLELFT